MAHHIFNDRFSAGTMLGAAVAKLGSLTRWCWVCRVAASRSQRRWPRRSTAPLDVIVVRKLGVPAQPELAMGAIGEDGIVVVNDDVVQITGRNARRSSMRLPNRERDTLESFALESIRAVRPRRRPGRSGPR